MAALRVPPPQGDGALSVVRIGPMRRRHLPGVLRIERQVYPRPWTMTLYLGELALPATRVYLTARVGARVVGYGGVMMAMDDSDALDLGHITTVAVDPTLQRQRIGTRLMLVLVSRAVAMGARKLTLEVRMSNQSAQDLYRRFGFAPIGVRKNYYAEVNEDALIMWAHDVDGVEYAGRLAQIEATLPMPTAIER